MQAYQKGPVIGEGTYGSVICATQKATGRQVAIKKVRLGNSGKDGVNMSVLRELKALRSLAAPFVVELLDTFSTKSSLVLVFEFMEWSLEDVVRDKNLALSEADVKSYMQMMLQALVHVHSHQALHRDIKPDNLLISSNGQMKLADFGLARFMGSPTDSPDSIGGKMTPQVFGRWYRPPELLMGSNQYSYGVDIWAAGCVFAELLLRKPWFPGNCDMDQLDRIFKVLGVPTPEIWPGYADLPHRIDFNPAPGQPLQQVFKQASNEGLDLLQRLMAYDPTQRISAADALSHPYFSAQPAPTPPAQLPRPASTRLNRLGLTRVPAVIPDMLMPHRLLQQQQQGFSTAGVAAAGWADAGEAGEALLMQQQQQRQQEASHTAAAARGGLADRALRPSQNGSTASRLLAFSDAPSFSGRFLMGQGLLPAGQPVQQDAHQMEGHLQGQQQQQQHQHLPQPPQQRPAGHQQSTAPLGASLRCVDSEQEAPWKGRLSFGGLLDDAPSAAASSQAATEEPAATAAGVGGDENTAPSGLPSGVSNQQQQQHVYRRPSPIGSGYQQQQKAAGPSNQHPSNTSLRPPLHPNATPVHLRTAQHASGAAAAGNDDRMLQQQQHRQGGVAAAGPAIAANPGPDSDQDAAAAAVRQRRGVSDLSAALSSAAAAGPLGASGLLNPLAPLLGGLPRSNQQHQQQHLGLLNGLGQQGGATAGGAHMQLPSSTPASAAVCRSHAAGAGGADAAEGGAPAASDADMACPMSLGTSARKRSRTVFEAPRTGGAAAAAAGPDGQQHNRDDDDVAMFSSDRRVVRGRRSSVGSGCCSMEMDGQDCQGAPAGDPVGQQPQLQQGAAGGMGGPLSQLCAEDRTHSITSEYVQNAMAAAQALQQQQHNQREWQQQHRELQDLADMPPPHAVHPRTAGPAAGAAAAAGGTSHSMHQPRTCQGNGAAGVQPSNEAPTHHCSYSRPGSAAVPGSGGSTCPMSLDHAARTSTRQQPQQQADGSEHQQQPSSSGAQRLGSGGINSGDLVTGGRPTADELRSMDPAELAELAKFLRPRLDSAERRYLRCRTMQLGEALLQASQPDDVSEGPEYHHFPGMDSSPSGGGLFDTPARGGQDSALCAQHRAQQHWDQRHQHDQQPEAFNSPPGLAAAAQPSSLPGTVTEAAGGVGTAAAASGVNGEVVGFAMAQQLDGQDGQGVVPGAATLTAA